MEKSFLLFQYMKHNERRRTLYQLKEVILKNGTHERKRLVIEFLDPNMAIVGEFLMTDANLLQGQILMEIDKVLSEEEPSITSTGNRCALEIKRHKTVIEDLFAGMDEVDALPTYEIDTKELKNLILMWREKLEAYNEKNV